jgi:alkanesulfonate monooxygenase SsuD/methylene tetrahydromethanopterin reductase-like flavin-dependent oxidoreductase (luciferase family)
MFSVGSWEGARSCAHTRIRVFALGYSNYRMTALDSQHQPSRRAGGHLPFSLSIITDARPEATDQGVRRYSELIAEARFAESLGFRAILTSEQHVVNDGYLGAQLPMLAGIATVTTTLRLVTSTILLPLYKARQLVEAAIVVDLLSAGRLELGVAAGAYAREFVTLGIDFHARGTIMEAALPELRRALTKGSLNDGPGGADQPISPRPAQSRIPILVGGLAPRAVDRAVRLADGHIAYDYEHPERVLPSHWQNVVEPTLVRYGKTRETFRYVAILHVWASDDPDESWKRFYGQAFRYQQRRYREMADSNEAVPAGLAPKVRPAQLLVGTGEEIANRLMRLWHHSPWTELAIWYRMRGISHEQSLQHLEYFGRHVIPSMQRSYQKHPTPSGSRH